MSLDGPDQTVLETRVDKFVEFVWSGPVPVVEFGTYTLKSGYWQI